MSIHLELNNLRNRIKSYQLKPDHSDSYLIAMKKLENAIQCYIEQTEMEINELHYNYAKQLDANIEIIKKQALIIEAANIVFPTINQPLDVIWDTYLASKNRWQEINNSTPTVTINII